MCSDDLKKNVTHMIKQRMVEAFSAVAMVAAVGSLLALFIEKIRLSRCTHIRLCGCCELERELVNPSTGGGGAASG